MCVCVYIYINVIVCVCCVYICRGWNGNVEKGIEPTNEVMTRGMKDNDQFIWWWAARHPTILISERKINRVCYKQSPLYQRQWFFLFSWGEKTKKIKDCGEGGEKKKWMKKWWEMGYFCEIFNWYLPPFIKYLINLRILFIKYNNIYHLIIY